MIKEGIRSIYLTKIFCGENWKSIGVAGLDFVRLVSTSGAVFWASPDF
jgi:hypothetical protein